MFVLLVICSIAAASALAVLLHHPPYIDTCEKLTSALPQDRLAALLPYVESPGTVDDAIFWMKSQGVLGLLRRQRELYILIRIVQTQIHHEEIAPDDAKGILRNATLQSLYCSIALIEAAACFAWKGLPHMAARLALFYHWQVTLAVCDACCTDTSPACIFNDGKLL